MKSYRSWMLCFLLLLFLKTAEFHEQECVVKDDGTCQAVSSETSELLLDSNEPTLTLSTTYGEPQSFPNDEMHIQRFRAMETYMHDTVMKDDDYSTVRKSCRNEHFHCIAWAVAGQCDQNQGYMQLHCAPACETCRLLDYTYRCQPDPAAENVWNPGDLDATFRRITEHSYYQTHYQPIILSQPGMINPFTRGDSPWIVLLHDFVTPHECETLIQLGHDRGYQRSKTIGAGRDAHGTLEQIGDYQGRTSKNAWCLEECYHNSVVQVVLDKLANLTGIDDSHAEYLQLLQYNVSEYYETHHDWVPILQTGLPGPRILTVFLYLNDVEAGGATQFTDLNITVQPKRGSALIWPSVLNDKPTQKDKRLHHAALAVEKGVKYGANAWYHQRNFKAAHARNCV